MTIISIEEAGKYEGQEVTIRGWLYNLRESGKLMFPIFRDGTGIIQGVCALKENPEAFEALKGLTQESSVIVTGKIRAEQPAFYAFVRKPFAPREISWIARVTFSRMLRCLHLRPAKAPLRFLK